MKMLLERLKNILSPDMLKRREGAPERPKNIPEYSESVPECPRRPAARWPYDLKNDW